KLQGKDIIYEITDLSGRKIYIDQDNASSRTHTLKMELQPGFYLVSCQSNFNVYMTRLMVR
ncbi:MAG: T9SS type A sorting domain-containing protein, partial [Bacteroidetes bacterium]|nr:T9SS type A sorting domain-containing protein [Bacteroidota bacterium]